MRVKSLRLSYSTVLFIYYVENPREEGVVSKESRQHWGELCLWEWWNITTTTQYWSRGETSILLRNTTELTKTTFFMCKLIMRIYLSTRFLNYDHLPQKKRQKCLLCSLIFFYTSWTLMRYFDQYALYIFEATQSLLSTTGRNWKPEAADII